MAWIVAMLEMEERNKMRILRKWLRDEINPFDIPAQRFIEFYRFPINLAIDFIEEIKEYYEDRGEIPLHLKVLSVFSFYATGSYQRVIGSNALHNMSQTMISRNIKEISSIIANFLIDRYINFPETPADFERVKERFFEETGYPNAIGIIDGTHVAITAVPKEVEMGYINHKGYHSLNVQVICDYDQRILNINSRYPGSTHDAFIWRNSKVYTFLKRKYDNNEEHNEDDFFWLIGDSGYPLQPWLMVPFRNPTNPAQRIFNKKHCLIRSRVENAIGGLKVKWRVLIENEQRYTPIKVANIIKSCAVLYNYLLAHGIRNEEVDVQPDLNDMNNINATFPDNTYHRLGEIIRNTLSNFFLENDGNL